MAYFKKYFQRLFLSVSGIIIGIFLLEFALQLWPFTYRNIVLRFLPDNDKVYIYVFGSSTPAGEPYDPDISLSKIINYMYDGKFGNRAIVIKNLCFSGSTIEEQYWLLYRELLGSPKKNSLLFVYSGLNDISADYHFSAFNTWNLLQKSVILSRLMFIYNNTFGDRTTRSVDKYRYRLEKTIVLAKSFGVNVFLSTLVGNFADCPPGGVDVFNNPKVVNLFNAASVEEKAGRFSSAEKIYNEMLDDKTISPEHVFFRLAKCYEAQRKYGLAKKYFFEAADNDAHAEMLRPTTAQNAAIRDLARKYNIELVDTLSAFEKAASNGLIGYNLIVDSMHPNLHGQAILAQTFSDAVVSRLGLKIRPAALSEKQLHKIFSFGDAQMFNMYISRAKWFMSVYHSSYYSEVMKTAENYIHNAEIIYEHNKNEDRWYDICDCRLLMCAVKNDTAGVVYWLDKGGFFKENRNKFLEIKHPFFDDWVKSYLLTLNLPPEIVFKLKGSIKDKKRQFLNFKSN